VSLGTTLGRLPALRQALAGASEDLPVTPPGDDLLSLGSDLCADVESRVVATLADDAPAATKDGGFVRAGFSAELDQLRGLAAGGRDRILAVEARERERTGIASLKVKYNNVFGYYIEITRAQLAQLGDVPSDYIRKQTVANAERFVTPELSEHEGQIASADERRVALELAMFEKLRSEVGAAAGRLQQLAARVATVDTLAALAEVAHHHSYVRPTVDESFVIDLRASRHPVVERLAAGDAVTGGKAGDHAGFVPNDVQLDADKEQLLLVTGPNMAGKSTLIRQTALAVVLAQMGGFVPAQAARIGLCDRVFTRVGAGDNLARGESTFLVEMRETAHILRNATRRSLVILDEIGRGTSTYDGVSIAWAVAEHLHDVLGARTLFATHYHELTALAETHARVANVSVAAREWQGEVVFLRKLTPGGASRSFGVEVARLAGLPAEVVARARAILATLEGNGAGAEAHGDGPRPVSPGVGISPQLALFQRGQQQRNPDRVPHLPRSGSGGQSPPAPTRSAPARAPAAPADPRLEEILATLRRIDPDDLSPRAAWDLLSELRRKLTESP
jgi:DNA mismatch repair protein MutS